MGSPGTAGSRTLRLVIPEFQNVNRKTCQDLFAEYCAPVPAKVKFVESKKEREGSGAEDRSGVGLAYFNTVEVRRL